jgi:hypothetical protein
LNLSVQARIPHQANRQIEVDDLDIFEGMVADSQTIRGTCIPKRVASLVMMVCCPVACFWALNLTGVAEKRIESVTFRMYIMKLVACMLEYSVHQVSETRLKGVGRRTKHAMYSAIFGLVAAVLTTISQINSRADAECAWEIPLPQRADCMLLEEMAILGKTNWTVSVNRLQFSWCCYMVRDGDS